MESSAVSKSQDLCEIHKLAKYQSMPLAVTSTTVGIFWKHCGSVQFEVENGLDT